MRKGQRLLPKESLRVDVHCLKNPLEDIGYLGYRCLLPKKFPLGYKQCQLPLDGLVRKFQKTLTYP